MEQACHVIYLPAELIESICCYCSPYEIMALSLATRKLLWLHQYHKLWRRQTAMYYPNIYHCLRDLPTINEKPPWWHSRWKWEQSKTHQLYFVHMATVRQRIIREKMAILSRIASRQPTIVKIPDIELQEVVGLMEMFPMRADYFAMSCYIIKRLVFQPKGRNYEEQSLLLGEYGAMDAIINGLKNFPGDVALYKDGLGALGNLELREENKEYVKTTDFADLVFEQLKAQKHSDFFLNACFALMNLCYRDEQLSQVFVERGLIEHVVAGLRSFPDKPDVHREIGMLLRDFTYHAEIWGRLLELDAISLVVNSIDKFREPYHSDMHGALINIALDVHCFNEMMKTNIVSILVGYLKVDEGNKIYWQQDVALLRNIASYESSWDVLKENDVPELLLSGFDRYPLEFTILTDLMAFFGNITHFMTEDLIKKVFLRGLKSITRFEEYKRSEAAKKKEKSSEESENGSSFVETALWALVLFLHHRSSPALITVLMRELDSLRCLKGLLSQQGLKIRRERIMYILKSAKFM